MNFRKMTSADVPAIFAITFQARGGSYTREGLDAAGITEAATIQMLDVAHSHEGWVCEVAGKIVGFDMVNQHTGELWVIVVLPDDERKGIGSKLHTLAEDYLRSAGWKEAWLGVMPDLQATGYAFLKKRGWVDDEMRGPFRIMKKSLLTSGDTGSLS